MRSARVFTIVAIATVALLFAGAPVLPAPPESGLQDQAASQQADMREAEAELIRIQHEIESLQHDRNRVGNDLAIVQAQLRRALAQVRRETARLRASETKLKSLTRQITDTELKLKDLTASLTLRARALFRISRGAGLEVLLSAEDATDFALRERFLTALTAENSELVGTARSERARLHAAKSAAEDEREERKKAVADLESARREVAARQRDLAARRNEINAQIRETQRKEQAVRRLIQNIQATIARSQRTPPVRGTTPIGPAPSRWRRPVSGPRYDPNIRSLPGVFLECPTGSTVRSSADGVVVSVESFRGLGVTVVIGHGGGYSTAYGNLTSAAVRANERVAGGAPIGTSGESPYGPMLFFAIYKDGRPSNTAAELGL